MRALPGVKGFTVEKRTAFEPEAMLFENAWRAPTP